MLDVDPTHTHIGLELTICLLTIIILEYKPSLLHFSKEAEDDLAAKMLSIRPVPCFK